VVVDTQNGSTLETPRGVLRPKIECEGINHWFPGRAGAVTTQAIVDTNLGVQPREFVSIVGPSGCGKTTLLNMMAGLIRPTSGRILIDGDEVTCPRPDEIGYMFARNTLLPWRTVAKNVELGLEFDRIKARREQARDFLAVVGLEDFARHYPDQLSQGMRQRVALACTLVRKPQIILMDEPFGALDAQTRTLIQNEFLRLWEAHQSTVVLVTHDLVEALALSDRVIIFSASPGSIVAQYEVNLQRPRRVDELQIDPAFQSLYREIWDHLRVEVDQADKAQRALRSEMKA
jgi:NitT/TauT family transport system ATP-binding protein